jgi:hypothetical protein
MAFTLKQILEDFVEAAEPKRTTRLRRRWWWKPNSQLQSRSYPHPEGIVHGDSCCICSTRRRMKPASPPPLRLVILDEMARAASRAASHLLDAAE